MSREQEAEAVLRLFDLMATLRGPGGCPWDARQTHASLLPYLLEETYEVVDAVASGDGAELAEELGDLLVEVAMQTAVAAESGEFDLLTVVGAASQKMISRHPHVFGDRRIRDQGELLRNWERLKRAEKPHRTSALDGVPGSLPALLLAASLQRRAARGGPGMDGLGDRPPPLPELAARLAGTQADDPAAGESAGELLWAAVAECLRLGLNPELELRSVALRRAAGYRRREQPAP